MKASTIGILVMAALTAGLIGVLSPGLVQHAMAQSASSTGASTDFGSAASSASANFFTGGSTSSSSAGTLVDCASEGATPASECIGVR